MRTANPHPVRSKLTAAMAAGARPAAGQRLARTAPRKQYRAASGAARDLSQYLTARGTPEHGNGATAEEAVADLREAVRMVIEEDGIPAGRLRQGADLCVRRPTVIRAARG